MSKNALFQENPIASSSTVPFSKIDVLSLAEQRQLISGSYCHQYGILIRLAILSGLSMSELLGLQWSDLDPECHGLHVRHTFDTGNNGYELRSKSAPRFVSLPSYLFKELANWYDDQQNTLVRYQLHSHSNSIAATCKGHQIVPWLMEYFFHQILQFCNLPKSSFSILRNTFACNAIKQGMKPERLCSLLGDPFAEITYAHFYNRRG